MAIRKFPENSIKNVISSAEHKIVGNEKENRIQKVHINLSKDMLEKIDDILRDQYPKTRSEWIRQAILEKLMNEKSGT